MRSETAERSTLKMEVHERKRRHWETKRGRGAIKRCFAHICAERRGWELCVHTEIAIGGISMPRSSQSRTKDSNVVCISPVNCT